ncbi:MAG TPA: hypothetical protein VLO00_13340, partial [Cryobacterium sp.]|nr:hypothetical protein [Cryobacterium sp.]
MINRDRLAELYQREMATFAERNPTSAAAYDNATHLFGKVPMTWMNKKAGGFPLYLAGARGNRVTDLDGHEYIDFALGARVDEPQTSRVAEFNDLEGLERQLAHGDVAAVLIEPALTNIGI